MCNDDAGKNPQWAVGDVVQAVQQHLPELIKAITGQYSTGAKAEYDIAKEYSPKIAQLQADVLGKQGKELAKTGDEINAASILAASKAEADAAAGSGQDIAAAGVKAQQAADPEYYAARKAIGDSIAKYLDFDPNQLNKGETEGIARGLGRTASFVPSAMETAKNAVVFGKAGQERRKEYGNAISSAANATNALRGPVDAAALTGKRQILPNVGTNVYTGVQTPGVTNTNATAGNIMGTGNAAMAINMNKELSDWDKYNKGASAVGSTIGSVISGIAGL